MTIWSDNVTAFVTRRDETGERIDAVRAAAVTSAVALLVKGRPGQAEYVMARGLLEQARLAGIGVLQLGSALHGVGSAPAPVDGVARC